MQGRALFTTLLTAVCVAALAAGPAHWTLVRLAFSAVCHQIPARSFWIAAEPMPLCARCTGIYFGALVSLVCRARFSRNGLLAAAAMVTIDVITEATGLPHEIAMLRLATGSALGWFAAPVLPEMLPAREQEA